MQVRPDVDDPLDAGPAQQLGQLVSTGGAVAEGEELQRHDPILGLGPRLVSEVPMMAEPVHITILQTADLHGQLETHDEF